MVWLPAEREFPATVIDALPWERFALPSVFPPTVKVTVPVGKVVPLAGFTEAVTTVLAVEAMVAGIAETLVVVAMAEDVTLTVVEAVELVKAELPL